MDHESPPGAGSGTRVVDGPAADGTDAVDDEALIAAVRQGRTDLYGELYRRHSGTAHAYARRLARTTEDAADIVAEAFTRLLAMLRRGAGPVHEFRPYLTRTIRNIAYDRASLDRRVELTGDPAVLESAVPGSDPLVEMAERARAREAFRSLPDRWQQVLWLTCVEGSTVDSACDLLGINPNALTSLAYRAREGLRQAYLQANVPPAGLPRCVPHSARLGALVRGTLGPSARRTTEAHTSECERCGRLLAELSELNAEVREQVVLRKPLTAGTSRVERLVATTPREGADRDGWPGEQVA